jgi:glycosyltransferase involved in cell wall biosynthesis
MQDCIGVPGFFKKKYDIKTPHMILSCGGYWPNKGMHELAATFRSLGLIDTTLVTTGYANAQDAPKECEFVRSIILDDRREVYNAMADADLYVMNSTQEGFGLVLLEAMANQLPWAARDIAGATELKQWGFTYTRQEELADFIKLTFSPRSVPPDAELLYMAKEYVSEQRQITNTVDDIEAVLKRPR